MLVMENIQEWLNQLANRLMLGKAFVSEDKKQHFLRFNGAMLFLINEKEFNFKAGLKIVNQAKLLKPFVNIFNNWISFLNRFQLGYFQENPMCLGVNV